TRLSTDRGNSLYDFWGSRITDALNAELEHQRSRVLVNLASNEYFKAVRSKELAADVISPVFKDYKGGQYKLISFFAKRARGLMSAYIIRNRIDSPRDLTSFAMDGYRYSETDSTPASPAFLRRAAERPSSCRSVRPARTTRGRSWLY